MFQHDHNHSLTNAVALPPGGSIIVSLHPQKSHDLVSGFFISGRWNQTNDYCQAGILIQTAYFA